MKRVVKAAKAFTGNTTVKILYGEGLDSWSPTLMSLTITRPDPKEALAVLLANLDDFHPDVAFDGIDEYTVDEILDSIAYHNSTSNGDNDYIFLLEINGEVIIDNTEPEKVL